MPDIQTLLAESTQQLQNISDSAQLDAEILLSHTLNKAQSHLRAWPEKQLTEKQVALFQAVLQQRLQGIPIAYLTGKREFWSRDFITTPDVLIPRPDTETLIEYCLELLAPNSAAHILDLGTGSGAIAITLGAERPNAQVIAVDKSAAALAVAQQNAQLNNVKNVQFTQSDWFEAVPKIHFDVIVSNPPYIAPDDPHLQQGDIRFEPDSALIAPESGLQDIKIIAEHAANYLKQGGYLILEHGYNQQAEVQALLEKYYYTHIHCLSDLSGQPRVSYAQYQG